jgi:hypothetical protein
VPKLPYFGAERRSNPELRPIRGPGRHSRQSELEDVLTQKTIYLTREAGNAGLYGPLIAPDKCIMEANRPFRAAKALSIHSGTRDGWKSARTLSAGRLGA